MELFKLLIKALWISAIVFALYWIVKYLYKKFKPQTPIFFYLLSVIKSDGEWKVKIESPEDDFDVELTIKTGQNILAKRNARLKAGVNNVFVKSASLNSDDVAEIKIQSADQKLERTV
jgi:hypothetical protein